MKNALTKFLGGGDDLETLPRELAALQAKRTVLMEKRRGYEASQRANSVSAVDGNAKARAAVESANAAVRKVTDEIATVDLAIEETRRRLIEAEGAARRAAWETDLARLKSMIKARAAEIAKGEEAMRALAAALPAQQELAEEIQALALKLGSPVTADGKTRPALHFADLDQAKWRFQMFACELGIADPSPSGWLMSQAAAWQKEASQSWGDLEAEEHRETLIYAMSGRNRPKYADEETEPATAAA